MPDDTATGSARGLDRVVELSKPSTGLLVSEMPHSERAAREVAALAAEIQRIAR